tara:strand:- start:179 stop:355 length:177 start_codon:yes stop_codon:yes gene_type:complete
MVKRVLSREAAKKQSRRMGKQAMTSDEAYRVEAKKGGKMNAGLKAYLAKKKKMKKGKK